MVHEVFVSDTDRSGAFFPPEEQEADCLKKALSLRMPVFEKGTAPKERLAEYEEFMVLTAFIEAELASDKWRCIEELNRANDDWHEMDTASDFAGTPNVSQAQKERERRENDPDLYRKRRYLTQRIEQLVEQIVRMERQAKICSRVHTFETGT